MQDEAHPTNHDEHPTPGMPKPKRDAVLDLTVVEDRARALREWLQENGANCFSEQRHLNEGTPERVYWHYGYMIALQDVLRFLTGDKITERSPSDKSSSSRAA